MLTFEGEFYKGKKHGKGKEYYNFREEEVKYFKGKRVYNKDCILIQDIYNYQNFIYYFIFGI